ncbi:MAG: potassium channel protein [Deltaproteobacteria bacterium]|nr:potassium channel protein [Deltaproteobacteria bacterium]MBI4795378.1 potassium channel protein [Deltaproteobacteria bacterium]
MLKDHISRFVEVLHRERVFNLLLAVTLLVLMGGTGFSLLEPQTGPWLGRFGNGIWWSLVTLTTVGYGDVVPQSFGGRLVGVCLMLGGVLSLSLLTATVASVFVERKFRRERGLEAIKTANHILILGWHYDGEVLLDQLLRRLPSPIPVVLVNKLPPEQLEGLKERYPTFDVQYLWGDPSREEILEKAKVRLALKAMILAERQEGETAEQVDQRTLLTALTLKSLNSKIRVLAELLRPENRAHLERAGVDEVLIRGQYDSSLMAGALASPGLFHILATLLVGGGQDLWAVEVPPRFQGRPLGELAQVLKERHQALPIAVYTEGQALALEDLLSGEPSGIDEFIRRKFTESGMTHLFGRTKVDCQVNPADSQILGPHQYVVVIAPRRPVL